jgi:predicted aconitase
MWSLEALKEINQLAATLARAGKPERDAIFIFTDARVRREYEREGVIPIQENKTEEVRKAS